MRAGTSIILIVISLAAVAGVGFDSYRTGNQTRSLDRRVAALEVTGVVLAPGSPAPNFDVHADPPSAPDRIILALYDWCQGHQHPGRTSYQA